MNKVVVLVVAALSLAGCKVTSTADIYTSDVQTVLETNETITTPMVIGIEVPSESGCARATNGLLEPLSVAFGDADYIGCQKEGLDVFAQFRVPVELVHEIANGQAESTRPIYVGAYQEEGSDLAEISYFYHNVSMDELVASLPPELTQFHSGRPSIELSAVLSNDLPQDIAIVVNDVFADGSPIKATQEFNLPRRGEVKIDLSNVTNTAFGQTDAWVQIAKFPMSGG